MIRAIVVALSVLGAAGFLADPYDGLFGKVLYNVERQIAFFSSDYSDINVDGLFGLRMAQGQIVEAVEQCYKTPACARQYLSKLKSIESQIGETSDKALPYVKQSDPAYYQRFLQTISKAWILPYQPMEFDETDLTAVTLGTNSTYNEDYGDACYARVMGTFDKNLPRCTMTPECWKFMTSENTSKYAITHQLLYFIVIEHVIIASQGRIFSGQPIKLKSAGNPNESRLWPAKVGCLKQVEKDLHGHKIRDVQTRMCKKIYKEAQTMVKNGNVKSINQDLFLEQTVLCGPLGYESFMREDWMKIVLRWLDARVGCFRMTLDDLEQLTDQMVNDVYKNLNVSHATYEKAKLQAEEESKESFEKEEAKELKEEGLASGPTMRKLMREKGMKDDCLAHTSGLGFGVYATYLNYLILHM